MDQHNIVSHNWTLIGLANTIENEHTDYHVNVNRTQIIESFHNNEIWKT